MREIPSFLCCNEVRAVRKGLSPNRGSGRCWWWSFSLFYCRSWPSIFLLRFGFRVHQKSTVANLPSSPTFARPRLVWCDTEYGRRVKLVAQLIQQPRIIYRRRDILPIMAPQAPATMAKQSTPKTMSSRLMTMKFMQRGAAQAAAEASSPSTPKTDEERSASKRRKVTHKSSPATPSTPIYDQKAIQAAVEEEEKKRLAAIEKRAAELGDSHWVLDDAAVASAANGSKAPLNIVQVGFAQIDYDGVLDGAQGSVDLSNKTRFRFNMKRSKARCGRARTDRPPERCMADWVSAGKRKW